LLPEEDGGPDRDPPPPDGLDTPPDGLLFERPENMFLLDPDDLLLLPGLFRLEALERFL
jgi:hypothetical protein